MIAFIFRFILVFMGLVAPQETLLAHTDFAYGDDCQQLGQLSQRELRSITHKAYKDYFSQFCRPEGVYSCQDYNALLEGIGRLEENNEGSCRLNISKGEKKRG